MHQCRSPSCGTGGQPPVSVMPLHFVLLVSVWCEAVWIAICNGTQIIQDCRHGLTILTAVLPSIAAHFSQLEALPSGQSALSSSRPSRRHAKPSTREAREPTRNAVHACAGGAGRRSWLGRRKCHASCRLTAASAPNVRSVAATPPVRHCLPPRRSAASMPPGGPAAD